MNFLLGILLAVWGLGLMAFGLWLFYAFLPLWYGLFGGLLGWFLGSLLTGGSPNGWFGTLIIWVAAILGAAIFAGLAYQFEPFRRILIGLLMGFSLGALLAGFFGGGIFFTALFGGVGALIFAVLVPLFFDPMIIVGSSFSGAALVMDGVLLMLPFLGFALDRNSGGQFLPIIVYIVLGAIGLAWQIANIGRWVHVETVAPPAPR